MAAEPEIVNHVPDEVCVLIHTSRTDNIGEMYQQVRDSLNGALRSVVEQPSSRAWADNDDLRRELIPEALQTRFNDASGVNIDTEMSNLLTLQTAYSANARVMTAIKQMFDMLLNIGA